MEVTPCITAIGFLQAYQENSREFQCMVGVESGNGKMIKAFISRFLLEPKDTLVEVVNWWSFSFGEYGPEWLTVRVNELGGGRRTATFIWNSDRFKDIWRRLWKA